jgi:hypothetical protein
LERAAGPAALLLAVCGWREGARTLVEEARAHGPAFLDLREVSVSPAHAKRLVAEVFMDCFFNAERRDAFRSGI